MSGLANSSATGGYLQPLNALATDVTVMDAITGAIVGITGLPGNLVRPRWQVQPPRAPEITVDWCAAGITQRTPLDYPAITHTPGGPDTLTRWLTVTVLVSMYGPDAMFNASALRDGLYVPQNLAALNTDSIKLLDAGEITMAPELVNNQWYQRADISVRFSVAEQRQYNVLDIASAQAIVSDTDGTAETVNISE